MRLALIAMLLAGCAPSAEDAAYKCMDEVSNQTPVDYEALDRCFTDRDIVPPWHESDAK